MITYKYSVDGEGGNGQTWFIEGEVTGITPGNFVEAISAAMSDSFNKLTQGKATYGNPGIGCSGPYTVRRFEIMVKTRGLQ